MQFGGPVFVLAIITIVTIAWVMTTAIRARHGYPVEDEWGNIVHKTPIDSDEQTKKLAAENEQLKATVGRLEERLKVLERIATDPSRQLANEIDKLR
jgi:cell division protein FtsB